MYSTVQHCTVPECFTAAGPCSCVLFVSRGLEKPSSSSAFTLQPSLRACVASVRRQVAEEMVSWLLRFLPGKADAAQAGA